MVSGKGAVWLVKSSGRVMGPYDDQQVSDLLKDRIIVPLDEVARPCDRWSYIRDEPTFAKTVEELRIRNIRGLSDDTTTRGLDSTNATRTPTASMTESMDELTVEIQQPPTQGVQDVLFRSIDDHIQPKGKSSGQVYTHEKDLFVRRQANESAQWMWIFTFLILFSAGGFVLYRQYISKPQQSRMTADDSVLNGVQMLEMGEYERATEFFNRAHSIDANDTSIYLYLGVLKIQISDQAFQGRRLLEKLKDRNDKDLKRVLAGIGLAYLKEGEYKLAEDNFNKSLGIDPLFRPAVVNLGAAALYQQDWAKATNHLLLAIKEGGLDGIEVLMLIESMSKLFEKEKDKRYLVEALRYVRDFVQKTQSYKLEAVIGQTYLEILLGEKNKIYNKIDAILDMDFLLTENHRHNLFVHRDRANWGVISQWCLKLTRGLDPNPRVVALEGLCLMKAGDIVEANRKIDDALAQAPKDPQVLSVYGFMLNEMNSKERALVFINKAIENDKNKKFEQPLRVKGYYCQAAGDSDCETQMWTELYLKNKRSLPALAGLSRVYLNQRRFSEAKDYLVKGMRLSEGYRPFFTLNKTISSLEDKEKSRGL